MNPYMMGFIFLSLSAVFAISAKGRFELLLAARPDARVVTMFTRDLAKRVAGVVEYALAQRKMRYYPLAGLAHQIIFTGFVVLLLRTIVLWGRGFYAPFNLFVLGPDSPLGMVYEVLKDVVALGVLSGACVFLYFRLIKRERRMTLSGEGVLILGILITMMVSDMLYDGAALALSHRLPGLACDAGNLAQCETVRTIVAPYPQAQAGVPMHFYGTMPAGSVFGLALADVSIPTLTLLAQAGFWTHASLVLIFMNLLPASKHFHIITSLPNVFTRNVEPPGRLEPLAKTADELGELVMKISEDPVGAAPVGVAKAEDWSWKAILDFYTCTECGRCSDNCPAHKTGKMLSPKQLTLNLRDHMYEREGELTEKAAQRRAAAAGGHGHAHEHAGDGEGEAAPAEPVAPLELVGNVIHPDVLWACTTCRACEEQCPVMISYVDKIVDMRRHLFMVKGEFPYQLGNTFNAIEVNGNPWNIARSDRGNWAEGLDIPLMSDKPDAKVLYWVGCAGSYDDRAKKIARATAKLLKQAGVDFAILGEEETCTGDPARRAGNEYLFVMLAQQNAETLNGYKAKGGVRTILTTCPHCFNTLKNEYPDFDAKFEVVHHTDYLLGLLAEKKLTPKGEVRGRVAYHDSCYLGRYNDVYESPREILKRIPGVELVEAEGWNRNKGLCCGAGGAQMWMEEQNKDRMNVKRTLQLLDAKPKTIASACPFCQTMLTDGLKSLSKEEEIEQLDVVEVLAKSCLDEGSTSKKKAKKASEGDAAEA